MWGGYQRPALKLLTSILSWGGSVPPLDKHPSTHVKARNVSSHLEPQHCGFRSRASESQEGSLASIVKMASFRFIEEQLRKLCDIDLWPLLQHTWGSAPVHTSAHTCTHYKHMYTHTQGYHQPCVVAQSVIPPLGRLRKDGCYKFWDILGYGIRPCFKH